MINMSRFTRSRTIRILAAALIAVGALSITGGSSVARNGPRPWQTRQPSGQGTVNGINPVKRTINVTHGPITALNWVGATRDLGVVEGVDIRGLKRGKKITFTLTRGADGAFVIDSIKPSE